MTCSPAHTCFRLLGKRWFLISRLWKPLATAGPTTARLVEATERWTFRIPREHPAGRMNASLRKSTSTFRQQNISGSARGTARRIHPTSIEIRLLTGSRRPHPDTLTAAPWPVLTMDHTVGSSLPWTRSLAKDDRLSPSSWSQNSSICRSSAQLKRQPPRLCIVVRN